MPVGGFEVLEYFSFCVVQGIHGGLMVGASGAVGVGAGGAVSEKSAGRGHPSPLAGVYTHGLTAAD